MYLPILYLHNQINLHFPKESSVSVNSTWINNKRTKRIYYVLLAECAFENLKE